MKINSELIAPWALPNEEIPVHMTWEDSEDINELRIRLPRALAIVEFFNIRPESKGKLQHIIPLSALQTTNYFGFVTRCEKIFENALTELPIEIDFALLKCDDNARAAKSKTPDLISLTDSAADSF